MDLPILSQHDGTDTQAIVRAARRAEHILARTMAEEHQLDQVTLFINPQRPDSPIANRAVDIPIDSEQPAPNQIQILTEHFNQLATTCGMLSLTEPNWPENLAEQASNAGYVPMPVHVLRLQSYAASPQTRDDLQLIPARASYDGVRRLYDLWADEIHPHHTAAKAQTAQAMTDQLDEPRLDAFIALDHGMPVGIAGVLSLGQVGVIRSVFTAREARRKSVATTLLAHTLDHCTRAQFTQILTTCTPSSPSQELLQRIGFEGTAQYVDYMLPTDESIQNP